MDNKEWFVSNEERDSKVPADVVEVVDGLRNLAMTRELTLEQMYAIDEQLLAVAQAIRNEYGTDAKFSYSWHKLAGSSVDNKGEAPPKDRVREIDDAVHSCVRETLAPFLESFGEG
jgi:hypothetical protein